MNIIPHKPGYSDAMMFEYISNLKAIITKVKTVTVGTGKNMKEIKKSVYKTNPIITQKILDSYEYYKSRV
jgi:hypothetical protein